MASGTKTMHCGLTIGLSKIKKKESNEFYLLFYIRHYPLVPVTPLLYNVLFEVNYPIYWNNPKII